MSSPSTPPIASSSTTAITANPTLSNALQRGLRRPISALRSSMESLVREFDYQDPRAAALGEALGEVARLGRNVRDLIDYAYAPEPNPIACGVDEILYSSRLQLPRELWSNLLIARDLPGGSPMEQLNVDGPVLSRSIARLILAAGPAPDGSLLLRAAACGSEVHFSITLLATGVTQPEEADPMGLCHAIALRDLAMIGCILEERVTNLGDTTIVIRVPVSNAQSAAA